MARGKATKKTKTEKKRDISAYTHEDKQRAYNPPVGLVTPDTDKDSDKKAYAYDPHLDPQLVWAGKAEHTSFDVPTVSLHVHERIDPKTIVQAVKKKNGGGQPDLFHWADETRPIREAVEFYKHKDNWTNRLIAGDSLLVMNSLLEKEGMGGQVQMIYIDPPYGIKYGSNFQPFISKRDVKDGKDDDLTAEPEMIRAFRDTWELGIHSYLAYLRDRLVLSRELLNETGSCFVQIGEENLHLVRNCLDEVFGSKNFCRQINYTTTSYQADNILANTQNFLLWYAKDKSKIKTNKLFRPKNLGDDGASEFKWGLMPDGSTRNLTDEERAGVVPLPKGMRAWRHGPLTSQGWSEKGSAPYVYNGKEYSPGPNQHWKISKEGMDSLAEKGLLIERSNSLSYFMFLDDFPISPITNNWLDTKWGFDAGSKAYVVQTNQKIVQRCMLLCTEPGDLVFDPTCGSGTTASVAEEWGRRWITCDTSRIAIAIAKQRLLTSNYSYFKLKQPQEGIASGLEYEQVPHKTLSTIAYDEPAQMEILYDKPILFPVSTSWTDGSALLR